MWYILVMNGMEIESNVFVIKGSDYNITMKATFSGLNVTVGQKKDKDGAWGGSQV